MRRVGYIALTAIIALLILEGLLRAWRGNPPDYEATLQQTLEAHERLFPPLTRVRYDVRGLYRGAEFVELRVSQRRLIEPDPGPDARPQVLFLGGSTTEALYVAEPERWVARLNEPTLATYNAGQSGANLIDAIETLTYLVEHQGINPDLVVVTTPINDFAWQSRLEPYEGFSYSRYYEALEQWMNAERRRSRNATAELMERSVLLSRLARVVNRPLSHGVMDNYRRSRDSLSNLRLVPLEDCQALQAQSADFGGKELALFRVLASRVRQIGAKLLVMSEATSYLAPAGSFLEDVRVPMVCLDQTALRPEDAAALWRRVNRAYLDAAREVGADVFDLAEAMNPLTNGPDGGSYMYDIVHYTPRGTSEVARRLAPVLHAAVGR